MTSLLHHCLDNSTYVRRREIHSLRDEVWMHGSKTMDAWMD